MGINNAIGNVVSMMPARGITTIHGGSAGRGIVYSSDASCGHHGVRASSGGGYHLLYWAGIHESIKLWEMVIPKKSTAARPK